LGELDRWAEEERESKERERAKMTGSNESFEGKQSRRGYIPTNYSFQLIISSLSPPPPPSLSLS